ncbi:hypothetical protein ACFWMS_25200 [Peribacillus butanolivorans]|uniref:hypothetical protein n=1 Tax=Peribacillus butanolivorans TaxID=421767 RepID=UPI003648F045
MFRWVKEKIRVLYFLFFVLFYSLYAIFLKSDEWYSFKPLVIALAFTAILLILLFHFLSNEKVHSLLLDFFFQFSWLNGIFNWTISHLIMVTIFSLYSLSQVSTSSLFLIATILVLIIVHIIIKYLQDKQVTANNPYVVLWLGLISTFIGFTLSGYTQEAFKEKDEKENLISTIDLALAQEENLDYEMDSKWHDVIEKVKEEDEIILEDIEISKVKNTALEQIINNGDFYNRLSPDARDLINFDSTERLLNQKVYQVDIEKEFEKVKNKQSSKEFHEFVESYSMALNMAKLEIFRIITLLELEKKSLSGSLNQSEYQEAYKEKLDDYEDYMENFANVTYDDYLESVTKTEHGYLLSNPVFQDSGSRYVPSLQERFLGFDTYFKFKLHMNEFPNSRE